MQYDPSPSVYEDHDVPPVCEVRAAVIVGINTHLGVVPLPLPLPLPLLPAQCSTTHLGRGENSKDKVISCQGWMFLYKKIFSFKYMLVLINVGEM